MLFIWGDCVQICDNHIYTSLPQRIMLSKLGKKETNYLLNNDDNSDWKISCGQAMKTSLKE